MIITTAYQFNAVNAHSVTVNGKQKIVATWIGYKSVNRFLYLLNKANVAYRVKRIGRMTTILF
ncbi:hypothetical protein RIF25_12965 [Thermosynechococcaceae cyanobacterium BACA0444]|uniref:Uncharacterized protein n=1 Tax=Pseudocalidococcus azoricus BACA0444 TaxID=2918990 RepID=A0AAE4FUM8_9CYAN|nr:hypothetical protein [Pseudocalidococcus azoricus]MDS3861714.1 hypothetical protein [Pseudocalidococcus azoricus BACA0444]